MTHIAIIVIGYRDDRAVLDPVLLQTFLAIAQTRSFTRAAEPLGLRQSTVSQHIRKLEDEAGRRLFVRDTHSVTMTADGEAMIEFARASWRRTNEQSVTLRAPSSAAGCGSAPRRIL
jgi:DNA-binding transcriptional LysR family regulator